MTTPLGDAVSTLRQALLMLEPTGENGFEGFLEAILTRIAGQPFRLASSGHQGGLDGETATDDAHVAFEAKLYGKKINNKEVLYKITSIIGRDAPPDLWILGATVPANTQLLGTLRSATEKNGIATLILDWPAADAVPPLAAACAMAAEETIGFLSGQLNDRSLVDRARSAIEVINTSPEFVAAAERVRIALAEPSAGLALARPANRRWLERAFGDRRRARDLFGQPLAPRASNVVPTRPRPVIAQQIGAFLTRRPGGAILAIVGGEGAGKSWAFAEASLATPDAPPAIFVPADELQSPATGAGLDAVLTGKLIQQTGDSATDAVRMRWERRFSRWRRLPKPASPRFVLCVDGLNQKPEFDWPRWLDGAAVAVEELGGALAVTVRRAYLDERLRLALTSDLTVVEVPEWTETELEAILRGKKLELTAADAAVRSRLRNPRLLGVALELLEAGRLQNLSELSVERLLFEHIRAGERAGHAPEPPEAFTRRLSQHAQEILDRVRAQRRNDRDVFERALGPGQAHELTAELLAVSGENFFRHLPEDATLYRLTDDGLSLALGLAVLRVLQKAERNSRDLADALQELLEPIAALDKTADALFSAVLVAGADDRCSAAIREALIAGYLRLQNLGGADYPAFRGAMRTMIDSGMAALHDLATGPGHAAHKDWLGDALRERRADEASWRAMSRRIQRWLRTYSLAPGLAVATPAHEGEKHAQEVTRRAARLSERWDGLSPAERRLFEGMSRDDKVDPGPLHEAAFNLLAGMPLAAFTDGFLAYSLSESINSGLGSPYDRFLALLRFNVSDWAATRAGLLQSASVLGEPGVSEVGRWARVQILRGLATPAEADEEQRLVEELTADRERFKGWRLVERYCATDPCDPASSEPANLAKTAEAYAGLRFPSGDDSAAKPDAFFVQEALTGVARFRPDAAVAAHRNQARAGLGSKSRPLMEALVALGESPGLLDGGLLGEVMGLARKLSAARIDDSQVSNDKWIASQHALLAAFPHLSGDEQADLLASLPPHGPPIVDLVHLMKPASEGKLQGLLQQALESGDANRKLAALAFAADSGSLVSETARRFVRELSGDGDSAVRSEAMAVIIRLDDAAMIQGIAERGWSAQVLDQREHRFEAWRGSHLLVRAFELGLLPAVQLLDRTTPCAYGRAVAALDGDGHRLIAERLGRALAKALEFDPPFRPPPVELRKSHGDGGYPPFLFLGRPETEDRDESVERLTETAEDFFKRQRAAWESYDRFDRALTFDGARLIAEDVDPEAIQACVDFVPGWPEEIAGILLAAPRRRLPLVRNFGLEFARALSGRDPELAARAMRRLAEKNGPGIVDVVYGDASVPLEALCVWGAADHPAWDELRFRRLDTATDDQQIALEVLAALHLGKDDLLHRYASGLLAREEPASQARALMVLGFGEPSELADRAIARYSEVPGWIGKTAGAASFARERNRWAKHWFALMRTASTPEEHWALSVPFLKIVDGRFEVWRAAAPPLGPVAEAFEPGLGKGVRRRVRAWASKRAKTLFGQNAPPPAYIATG